MEPLKQIEQRLYEAPVMKAIEIKQGGVICASGIRNEYDVDDNSGNTHWTVDHVIEDNTPDDEWEEEQEQDWGDSWGDY